MNSITVSSSSSKANKRLCGPFRVLGSYALLAACLMAPTSLQAATYDEASDAYDSGDYATALKIAEPLANAGDSDAQFLVALMHDEGDGVVVDDALAIEWYTMAADVEHVDAQFNLALMYDFGEGTKEDNVAAIDWYTRAAEQGHVSAQLNLALMYDYAEDEVGVSRDVEQAVKWYTKAARQDHTTAQYNLAITYDDGDDGVAVDDPIALYWYKRAALLGHADAQNNLAVMYFNGEGTRENTVEALAYVYMAAETGDEMALDNKQLFESEASRREIRQAKRRFDALQVSMNE